MNKNSKLIKLAAYYDLIQDRTSEENLYIAILNRAILDLDFVIKFHESKYKYCHVDFEDKRKSVFTSRGQWQKLYSDLDSFFFNPRPRPCNLEFIAQEIDFIDEIKTPIRKYVNKKMDKIKKLREQSYNALMQKISIMPNNNKKLDTLKSCTICGKMYSLQSRYTSIECCSKRCLTKYSFRRRSQLNLH